MTAPRLVDGVHLIPGFWGIDVYGGISRMITETFDVVPGETYIEFPYDWRRDNRVAARQLQRLVDEKLHAQRQRNPDAKVILIGHSMGGLVARWYLECLGGWQDTRALITFGTPHRGSLNAVDFLVNGFVKKLGPLKVADLSRLLRSLTSVYQLLPIYPCVDVGAGNQRVAEVALPGVDQARAQSALTDFHRAIEAAVGQRPPNAYALHSVVGITQGTKQSGRLEGDRVVLLQSFDGEDMGGDGTVPRVSATPIETDDDAPPYQPMYSSEVHGSLQVAEAVQTQLLGILTARPPVGFRGGRGIAIEADDLLAVGEPLAVRALPDVAGLTLRASVVDVATGRSAARSSSPATPTRCTPASCRRSRRGTTGCGSRGSTCRHRWPTPCTRCCASSTTRRPTPSRDDVTTYALLVGVDAYQPPLTPLYGCRNDIAALETYLERAPRAISTCGCCSTPTRRATP